MYLQRVLLNFLLIFGLNIPFNVVSDSLDNSDSWYCDECNENDLIFYTAGAEVWKLTNTGKSVEIIPESTTNGTVTGGVLGSDVYEFYKLEYDWTTIDNKTTFEIRVIFFNEKYSTFENAINYPDGVIQVYVPVNAMGADDNSQFSNFEKTIKKVKNPGDFTYVCSKQSYSWFSNYPQMASYYYSRSPYLNKENTMRYSSVGTIDLPAEQHLNFISLEQVIWKNNWQSWERFKWFDTT